MLMIAEQGELPYTFDAAQWQYNSARQQQRHSIQKPEPKNKIIKL